MFALIVVVLTSVCAVVFDGVSPLIAALFSSVTTLLVPCSGGGGGGSGCCDGLPVALGIKPGAYGLGGYGPGTCGLPA